jgi:hypothetical protein
MIAHGKMTSITMVVITEIMVITTKKNINNNITKMTKLNGTQTKESSE